MTLGPAPAARAAPKDDPAINAARETYKRASKHYQLGEYADALADYKEAFRLKEDPSFLFNIGQCHRLLGAHEEAARSYRAFLRAAPDSPNRADVEALIAGEDKAIEEERARAAAADELRRKEAEAKIAAAGATAGPWYTDGVGWGLLAGGLALAGGGAGGLGYGTTVRLPNPANMPALYNELHNRQTISYAVGGVGLAAGAGLIAGGIYRMVSRARKAPAAALLVTPEGALLVAAGSF